MSPYGRKDSFNSRVLSLPAVQDTVTATEDVYNKIKESSQIMGKTLEVAEVSMRRASAGALPLLKPFIDKMGGAEAIDQWMCDGLQKAEKAAPIITKPADEIVTETRNYIVKSTADLTNNTMQAMTNNPIGKATVDMTTQVTNLSLDVAHAMIDTVYPNDQSKAKVNNPNDVVEKATALVDKLQGMTEAVLGSTAAATQTQQINKSNNKNVSIFNKYN